MPLVCTLNTGRRSEERTHTNPTPSHRDLSAVSVKTGESFTMKDSILCLEDDPTIQILITESLRDYNVVLCNTISEAQTHVLRGSWSAILIDIQLPDGDGLRFLTDLQKNEKLNKIPHLVLSSYSDISNKVAAFSLGADDFITKPFDPIELQIRVSSKVRRWKNENEDSQTRQLENLLIDFYRQKAFSLNKGVEVDLNLTSIELKILSLLTRRMEQVYSREQILDQVWGNTFISDRTVDSHIAHLRQKIQKTSITIETAKNFGYRAILQHKKSDLL